MCKRSPIILSVNFSAGTLQARGQWDDIFKVLNGKNCQPRALYVAKKKKKKVVLEKWRKNKTFPCFFLNKGEGVHHHYNCLQEMLKGFRQVQRKGCWTTT